MSTRTISEAFNLPAKDRLQAMEFVARLRRRPGAAVGGGDGGFNAALRERGKAPFEFLNVEAVFGEVRREAQEYGDVVWKRLRDANIVENREAFEALAAGSAKGRERFARAWLAHKGRDASS